MNLIKSNPVRADRRIAVVGSGISGLSAAWLLSKSSQVVLYEKDARIGGHSNTVDIESAGGAIPVDTGFIVYNALNYPNLVALFDHLKVPTAPSDMSFAASVEDGAFEYSGSNLAGLFGQRRNAVSPRFWKMLAGILRFYREATSLAERRDIDHLTLGEYVEANGYSESFVEDHLLPMGAAIWSTTAADMRSYPLVAFVRFFVNHGLVKLSERPQWRTVEGGSREYVTRLLADFKGEVRTESPVEQIRRLPHGVEITSRGATELFDDVVIGAHADQALAMLGDADDLERELLGAFGYTRNTAVLHKDIGLMPKRRRVWSSWNYIGTKDETSAQPLCVTYWMNRLQDLGNAEDTFVTLNPNRNIAADKVIASFDYTHPLFDRKALAAQRRLWELQGRNRTWFCGAYFGSGFHEDGLQSGLAAADALGGLKRPWRVENESGRIHATPLAVAAE